MSIEIKTLGTNISIKIGDNTRLIAKSLVREVSVLKNNTLKLDIGGGALRNIFLPISEIAIPAHVDNISLLDDINRLLTPPEVAIQDELNQLQGVVEHLQELVGNMNPSYLQEPIFTDEGNPNVIYKGYAAIGSQPREPKFAIMRTTITDKDLIINEWANGNLNPENIWENRELLTYGVAAA